MGRAKRVMQKAKKRPDRKGASRRQEREPSARTGGSRKKGVVGEKNKNQARRRGGRLRKVETRLASFLHEILVKKDEKRTGWR